MKIKVLFREKWLLHFLALGAIIPMMSGLVASKDKNNTRRFSANSLRMKMEEASIYKQINTNKTSTLNYPYVAAVIINGRLWCSGAIVDVRWVLTAAHCLSYVLNVGAGNNLSKYVSIRVGSTMPHEGGKLVEVERAVTHPKYEEEPVPHGDVMLIMLVKNLEFTPYIHLISIYDDTRLPFAQSFVVVSAWGATRANPNAYRDHTSNLLSTRLKVRRQQYCEDAYASVNGLLFTRDFFCASLRKGLRDACLFDAGAPAVQEGYLVGIMSFGPEQCGSEDQPAVFIKAFYFRDFVKKVITSQKTNKDLIAAMNIIEAPSNRTTNNITLYHPPNEDFFMDDEDDAHLLVTKPSAKND